MVKVQQYLRNLGKSTVYSAAEVLSENFSTIKDFKEANSDLARSAYDSVTDYKNIFKRTKSKIENSDIYVAANIGIKALMQDITTGDFYNTKREQEIMNKYGGKLMDDSMFDMDAEEFSIKDTELDMSDGEKVIATAVKKNSKLSTAIVSDAVIKTGKAQIDVSRETTALLYSQNERLINKIGGGLDNLTAFLTQNAEQSAKVQNNQIANTNKFYTNMEKNTNRIVAQLDEMLVIQRSIYRPKEENTQKKKTTLLDIADGGIPDLKEYFNTMKSNFENWINEQTQGMFSMGEAAGGANIFAQFAASPMRTLLTGGMRKLVDKDFKAASKALNSTLGDAFINFIVKANANKDSSNIVTNMLGNLFGLKVDKPENRVNTGNYNKAAIPFDGVTKQSIIEVIPSYLRKIEAYLTGGDERLFDFKNGRWTTVRAVHAENAKWKEDHNKNMKNYLIRILSKGFGKNINNLFKNYANQEEFDKALNSVASVLASTGNLSSLNDPDNGLDENLVEAIRTVLRDDVNGGVKRIQKEEVGAKARAKYKTVIDPKLYKDSTTRMANKIATIYAETSRDRAKVHRAIEEDPITAIRMLYSEGIDGGKEYLGFRNKYGDLNTKLFDSPFAKAILHVKDNYGNTIYDYLRYMKADLTAIRNNGSMLTRGGARKNTDTQNLMDFERGIVPPSEYSITRNQDEYNRNRDRLYDKYNETIISEQRKYLEIMKSEDKEKRAAARKPVRAKDMTELESLYYDNAQYLEEARIRESLKKKVKTNTVWDKLYDMGIMSKQDRDKYKEIEYDSKKTMKDQMSELTDGISKLALFGEYAKKVAQKPWESATTALYKMDYWITSLFFGEDLRKIDPNKEDDERKGLFGIIKTKFKEGFENLVQTISDKFEKLMDDKIRPWMEKFLTPVKNFLFGKREDSMSNFEGGLLSPFLNNMKDALARNHEAVVEYAKREAEKLKESAKGEKENDDDDVVVRYSSSSSNTQSTKPKLTYNGSNAEHRELREFLVSQGVLNNPAWFKYAGKPIPLNGRDEIFTAYINWILNKHGASYRGGMLLWEATIANFLKEEKKEKKKDKLDGSKYSKKTGKLEVNWRAVGIHPDAFDPDKAIHEQLTNFSNLDEKEIKEYLEWCKANDIKDNDKIIDPNNISYWQKYNKKKKKGRLGLDAGFNKRIRNKNKATNRNIRQELADLLMIDKDDRIITAYIKWCGKLSYDEMLNPDTLKQFFTLSRLNLLDEKNGNNELSQKIKNVINRKPAVEKVEEEDNSGETIFDVLDKLNTNVSNVGNSKADTNMASTLTFINHNITDFKDKVLINLHNLIDLIKPMSKKISSIPNADPLNPMTARGGINRGKAFQSVVSSGEIVNGSIVPPGGPYITTIPKGGVVINPADESTIKRQAKEEKSFLNKLKRNAEVNDGVSGGVLNDKRTADVLVRGGIGGLIGLLLGNPLLGFGIGGASALHRDNGDIANALFGEFIEIDKDGKVVRRNDGLISNEIQKAVPDVKLGALVGGIGGLFTPFGPVGGLLIGSALGFAKNNNLIQTTLFGKEGLIKPDQVKKIKKALPAMGLGALAGSFLGPFGLVGNAILGASAGYVSSLDEVREAIFGKKDDSGKRSGGLAGTIKKSIEPLKDFGKIIIDGITDEIFGKVGKDGERHGGLFGMVKDHIVTPISDGITPMIQEGRVIFRNAMRDIPRTISDYLKKHMGEQWYANTVNTLGKVGRGALKAGRVVASAGLFPVTLGAHAVKGVGNSFRRKQIGAGNADDLTAFERNKFREKDLFSNGFDRWADIDSTLELFSANNSYDELEELRKLINIHTDNEGAIDKDKDKLKKDFVKTLEANLHNTSTRKIMKALNAGKFDEVDRLIKTDNSIMKNPDGSLLTPEQRQYLINKFSEYKNDRSVIQTQYDNIKASGKTATQELARYGIDIDLNNAKDVDKLSRYLDREVLHMKAGLSEEEKRKRIENDPDNPINKNTDSLKEVNETLQDLIDVMLGNKSKIEQKLKDKAYATGDDSVFENEAIKQFRESVGIESAQPDSEWVKERAAKIKKEYAESRSLNDIQEENNSKIAEIIASAPKKNKDSRKAKALEIITKQATDVWANKQQQIVDNTEPDDNGFYFFEYEGVLYKFNDKNVNDVRESFVKNYINNHADKSMKEYIRGPEGSNGLKKAINNARRLVDKVGVTKFALGTAVMSGLGINPISIAALSLNPVIGGIGLGLLGGSLALKGGKIAHSKLKTKQAGEDKLKSLALKDYETRMKNGELEEEYNSLSDEGKADFKDKWIEKRSNQLRGKRYEGLFGGIKNKIAGAKENVDRNRETASASDKFIVDLGNKIGSVISKAIEVKDDVKKNGLPGWVKAIFGAVKWGIGAPLLVGFMNDSIVPFIKNKIKPVLVGEYNETTGEYEGGIASSIINPLRKFFADKFGGIQDWFTNTGKYESENTGMKGMIKNLSHLADYLVDKWKSGFVTILSTVYPEIARSVIGNLPEIGMNIVSGILLGIKDLWDKRFNNNGTGQAKNSSSSALNTLHQNSQEMSNTNNGTVGGSSHKFNDTVGGSINVTVPNTPYNATPTKISTVPLNAVDITANDSGGHTYTNEYGETTDSVKLNARDVVSAGVNEAGEAIYYRKSDTKQAQPLIYDQNTKTYIPATEFANVAYADYAGNKVVDKMVDRERAGDTGETRYQGKNKLLNTAYNFATSAIMSRDSKIWSKITGTTGKLMGSGFRLLGKVSNPLISKVFNTAGNITESLISTRKPTGYNQKLSNAVAKYFNSGSVKNDMIEEAAEAAERAVRETIENNPDMDAKSLEKLCKENSEKAAKEVTDRAAENGIDIVKNNTIATRISNAIKSIKNKTVVQDVKSFVKDKASNSKIGKFIKSTGSAIKSTTNFAKNVFNTVKDDGIKGVGKVLKEAASEGVEGVVKNLKTKLDDIFTTIFKSVPFKRLLKNGSKEFSEEMLEKAAKKVAKEMAEKSIKSAVKTAGKSVVKTIAGGLTGGILTAVFVVADFITGMEDARNILGLTDVEVTWQERIIAGLCRVLTNAIWFIPETTIANILIDIVGGIFFKDSVKGLQEKRAQSQEALELYNQTHNTNLSIEEYNNKFNPTIQSKIGNAVGGFVDSLFGKDRQVQSDMEDKRHVTPENEVVAKIRDKAEEIAGRLWNKIYKKYLSEFFPDKNRSNYSNLMSQILDRVVVLINSCTESQINDILNDVQDVNGPIDFAIKGMDAFEYGYTNSLLVLQLHSSTNASSHIRLTAGVANLWCEVFKSLNKNAEIINIVVSVLGAALVTEKDKALRERISDAYEQNQDLESTYKGITGTDILTQDQKVYATRMTDVKGVKSAAPTKTTSVADIATNAKANDKLIPIGGELNTVIGTLMNNTLNNNMASLADIGKIISKLTKSNVGINKKIEEAKISPEDSEYWKINIESNGDMFANSIFKFNEIMSRIIKAPFALVTKTMSKSNSILASSSDSPVNTSGSSSTTQTSSSASTETTTSQSGFSKLLNNIKNGAKKLFSWITGKGKSDSKYGRGDNDDPYHIYQRDYSGSYQTNGDTEKQTIADSGCGPAAAASVLRMYGKEGSMKHAVNYALRNKYKEVNGGTYPEFFGEYLNESGINANSTSSNEEVLGNLAEGKPVILMGRDMTNSGKTPYGSKYSHYVVARGIDSDGNVIVEDSEDPNGSTRYSLADTLANSSVKITTGIGKYGRGTSVAENYINTVAGNISLTTAGMLSSILGANTDNKISTGSSTTSKYNTNMISTSDPGDTESRKKIIWNFFTSNGVSPNLTAGIMGNMQRESGFNPGSSEGGGSIKVENMPHSSKPINGKGMGFGLIQWSFSYGHAALYNWCTAHGLDPNSLEGQLNMILHAYLHGKDIDATTNSANSSIFGHDGSGTLSYTYPMWRDTYGGFDKINNSSIEYCVEAFYNSYERGADATSHINKSIEYAKNIYNKYTGGMGRGRGLDKIKSKLLGRGKFGGNKETTTTTTTPTTTGPVPAIPTPNTTTNTTPTTASSNVTKNTNAGSSGSFISKLGTYINETFKTMYGPYWDALYGDDSTSTESSGFIPGSGDDVIYAAAMVFDALDKVNPEHRYCACGAYYYDLVCRDGKTIRHVRSDCSGMMTAVIHYMGYYTFSIPNSIQRSKYGEEYMGGCFRTADWRTDTQHIILNPDGQVSTDWVYMDFDPNDRQPGDILFKFNSDGISGHTDMYVWTSNSNGSYKWRGFNAGSGKINHDGGDPGNGITKSVEMAKKYLETGSFDGCDGSGTIRDTDASKVLRFVGRSGTGKGKKKTSSIGNKGRVYKETPTAQDILNREISDTSSSGKGKSFKKNFGSTNNGSMFKLPSLPSSRKNTNSRSSNTSYPDSYTSHRHNDAVSPSINARGTEIPSVPLTTTQAINFDSLISVLEIIAENSAKTEQMIQLLSAIVTNTAVLGNTENNTNTSIETVRHLLSNMRANNNRNNGPQNPITGLNNMMSEGLDIAKAVYTIAQG